MQNQSNQRRKSINEIEKTSQTQYSDYSAESPSGRWLKKRKSKYDDYNRMADSFTSKNKFNISINKININFDSESEDNY